ncbi:SDR family oxidoreductase [Novosphingobium resinovorum]|uniref:Short-chain dehydrogenase n=1 Tax=Novosphingobium resinovorum TaxID=158500 RepID=A0A031JXR3_9SPHN|nr:MULTISPECIES: SDR family oxidoreductase [Novosphingobium]AOR79960.1 short-chain dehydrogenase [Novosphingobium resinovorum]EZP81162.1 Short-chain dehydrogenase/reductase SDR [Novosphingobium resinovorum]MBF7014906.1 SDR family oxidoreductase [Novosphingobium sp. HR1a]WJM24617.1 SDR family oxidoreductase [Novosphingobium resinovorum]
MTIALPDVIAVVTGAAGGIGREIVKAMKAAGATVIATDLKDSADIEGADHYLRHDVTSEADWRAVEALVREKYGRLDALVNNAGFSIVTKFEDTPLSEFHKVNAINVDSAIIGTQVMLGLLQEGGKARASGSSVINFSSVGGLRGAAFNAAYCVSKAAIKMLSKCLGAEFAALKYNIRVNSVHPGGIDTPMLNSIMDRYIELGAAPSREASIAAMNVAHPIGRLGKPEEMAGGVVFLASTASSFMTCDELVMDGGFSQV